MSDQTPSLTNLGPVDGKNLVNVGGGLGVTSINGDATAAQILSAGVGVTIIDAGGGAHVISVTGAGVLTINGDNAAAQTIVAGTNITVTDLGGGAHRISSTGGTGVLTINGDGAAAQTIVAGANVTVTDLGGGAHRIAAAGGGLGNVVSINGDVTAAQTLAVGPGLTIVDGGGGLHTISLTGGAGITSINADVNPAQSLVSLSGALTITHPGAGVHNFSLFTFNGLAPGIVPGGSGNNPLLQLSGDAVWRAPITTQGGLNTSTAIPIPNGGITNLVSILAPGIGVQAFIVFYALTLQGIAGQNYDVLVLVNGTPQQGAGFTGMPEIAAQTGGVASSCVIVCNAGDNVTLAVNHHGGGAGTTSGGNRIRLVRIG